MTGWTGSGARSSGSSVRRNGSSGGPEARDEVLRRDLSDVKAGDQNHCIIFSGLLHDPYTGKELPY